MTPPALIRAVKALAAWAALAILVAGVPVLLVALVGWPLPHHLPTTTALMAPMSDRFIIDVIGVAGWLAWAQLTAVLAAEILAAIRGVAAVRVAPAGLQRLAAQLVMAAFALAGPAASVASAATPLAATAPIARTVRPAAGPAPLASSALSPNGSSADAPAPTVADKFVTVANGDTLWGLAEAHLGSGARSAEIWKLNAGRTMTTGQVLDQPGLIRPGWILRMPADATGITAAEPGGTVSGAATSAGRAVDSKAPAAPAQAASATTPTGVAADETGRSYAVQRGDTLWDIAQRHLGDPRRWHEIVALNDGRPQPNGKALTDPHWLDSGWTLLLPPYSNGSSDSLTPTPSPATAGQPGAPAPANALPVTPPAAPGPAHEAHRATAGPTQDTPAGNGPVARRPDPMVAPVELPSGSIVAGSFATGVLSAVALGRLRRRHAYRYRPPQSGRDLGADPAASTVRHLATAVHAQTNGDGHLISGAVPAMADDDVTHRDHPDVIEVGERNGNVVYAALSELAGASVAGPGADDVVRAWITALLVRAGPIAAEVLASTAALGRLLPDIRPVPGVRVVAGPERVLRAVEAEALARSRQLDDAEAADVVAYRQTNPWEPAPTILAVIEAIPAEHARRWAPILAAGARLGLATVVLEPDIAAPIRIEIGAARLVVSAVPQEIADQWQDVRLFGLGAAEAADVLTAVAQAEERPDSPDDTQGHGLAEPNSVEGSISSTSSTTVPAEVMSTSEPWPEVPQVANAAAPPITVRLLGPYEIRVGDQLVATGLRSAARELLAWYLLRPEGATVEAAVDALWPDTDPARVHKQFWTGAANLRTRLGASCEPPTKLLVQTGDVYRLDPSAIGCDLWQFQAALAAAAVAGNDSAAREELRRAIEVCGGDLVAGADYRWVEPVRQDLHRRVLDAHLRLAELETSLGAPDAGQAVLERAVELDRYAEEPYRRLMTLQGRRERPEAVASTWRLLQRRLAEIDVDPEPATLRLYRSLTTTETPSDGHRRMRLSS